MKKFLKYLWNCKPRRYVSGRSVDLYAKNYFVKSLFQAIPYAAPFIENAIENAISDEQRKNILEFARVLDEKYSTISKLAGNDSKKTSIPELGIEQSLLDRVLQESDPVKIPYFANIYICYSRYLDLNGKKMDVFPKHFFDVICRYTMSHIDVLNELYDSYTSDVSSGVYDGKALRGLGASLDLPGGVIYKILMDLHRDEVVSLEKLNQEMPGYGLGAIKSVSVNEYGLEFIDNVIQPFWDAKT